MTLRHKTVLAALVLVAPAGGTAGVDGPQGPAGPPPGSVYDRPAQMPLCELGPGKSRIPASRARGAGVLRTSSDWLDRVAAVWSNA
ncbi:MAG TPA: hypothetical protein VNP89_03060 [Gaiellaceae bacterium]|nr:hypothetical protein [Gaiellaceae bacterium]